MSHNPDTHNGNENMTSQPTPPKPRFFWRNVGIIFSGLAAGILIAVIILVSYALLAINHRTVQALSELTNRFNQSQGLIVEAQQNARNAEKSVGQTSDALKAQSQLIADIQKTQRTNRDDFVIAEAFYLVRMANDSLQYENNISAAVKLLQSADQDMSKITDARAYPVRKALATDLLTLQALPQIDVAGVYLRLSALSGEINKLPLITQFLNKRSDVLSDMNNNQLPWWRRGLNSIEQALQRIVIVRQNVPNAPPFIAPDQKIYLYQNLQAQLEKAQWGLLHRQPDIYRSSLSQASIWIKQYAVSDSPITKEFLKTLDELQQVNVRPNVPVLTGSMQALQTFMNNRAG